MTTVRVLLVDQNDDFLDAVLAWVGAAPDVQVVGRSHTGEEAILRLESLAVDVVVMDMALPDMSGLEATRRLKRLTAAPIVILTSFHGSRAARAVAADAGADECLAKADITTDLLPAIARLVERRDGGRSRRIQTQGGGVGSMGPVEESTSHIQPNERRKR